MVTATEKGFVCNPVFPASGEPECGLNSVSTLQVGLDVGSYVIGTVNTSNALYSASRPDDVLLGCGLENSLIVVPAGLDGVVEIQLATDVVRGFPALWLRDTDSLCEAPQNCCTTNGGLDAFDACSDAGLRDCVVKANPVCEDTWDFLCPDTAMFLCGADCT